jgi:hypothetical protein
VRAVPVTVTTSGSKELAQLAAALKAFDRNDLRKELLRGLREGAKPMVPAARGAAAAALPKRGGLAADVAGARWATRNSLGANASVKLIGAWSGHDMAALDSGRLRHPTFGHRPWKDQAIPAGWFTTAMDRLAPGFRDALSRVIDDISKKLSDSV